MRDIGIPSEVIAMIPNIGTDAFSIWAVLNANADSNGDIAASYQFITGLTGIKSSATISACLKVLVAVGLLIKKRNFSAASTFRVAIPSLSKGMDNSQSFINSTTVVHEGLKAINTTTINSSINIKPSKNEGLDNITPSSLHYERMTDTEEAIYVFQQVTGMVAIPVQDRDRRISELGGLVRMYGVNGAIEKLRPCWTEWQKRKGKNGRGYSRLNPGWIEWAVADEIPDQGKNGAHREEVFIDV
jgi:hypothetical protein